MHKKLISMSFFVLAFTLSVLLTLPQFSVRAQCLDDAGRPTECPQQDGGEEGGREKKPTRVPPPTRTLVPTETPTPVPTDTPIPTPTFTPVACPPSNGNAGIPFTGSDPSNLIGVSDEQQPEGFPWLFGGGGLLLGIVIGGLVTPGLFGRLAASTKGMVDPGDKAMVDPGDKAMVDPGDKNAFDPDAEGHSGGPKGSSQMGPQPHMAPQSDSPLGETHPPDPGVPVDGLGHSGGGGGGAGLPEPHMQAPPEGDMVGHSGGGSSRMGPSPHMAPQSDFQLGETQPPEPDVPVDVLGHSGGGGAGLSEPYMQAPPEGDMVGQSGGGSNRMGPSPHMAPQTDLQVGDTQPPDPDVPVDGLEGKGSS